MGFRHFMVLLIAAAVVAWAVAWLAMRNSPHAPVSETAAPLIAAATPAPLVSSAVPAASPSARAATPAPAGIAGEDASQKKLDILKEILESKNDNDPRLDSEFRDLDPATKSRLREFYKELPEEKLNSRGTVVFLLGRNIRTSEDAQFMNSVLRQAPCLSLASCGTPGEADPESSSDVTLAYPQIVATVGLVKGWRSITDPMRRAELLQSLKAAAAAPNPALARSARAALESIQKGQH